MIPGDTPKQRDKPRLYIETLQEFDRTQKSWDREPENKVPDNSLWKGLLPQLRNVK